VGTFSGRNEMSAIRLFLLYRFLVQYDKLSGRLAACMGNGS